MRSATLFHQESALTTNTSSTVTAFLGQIDRDGLAGFSTRKLGEALGVQAMSLYHHFPSKAHVLDAVLADVATSVEELDRAKFADTIAEMEAKLAEKEGSELDHAIERLDHFKSIQHELSSTAMH